MSTNQKVLLGRRTAQVAGVLSALLLAVAAPAAADPKVTARRTIDGDTKDYLVVVLSDASVTEYLPDGTAQPVSLSGRLHLQSSVALDEGAATEFGLHANLMDAFVTGPDDAAGRPAAGSVQMSFSPTGPCTPDETCRPASWSLGFSLPPAGSTDRTGDEVVLRVAPRYDAAGHLVDAVVVELRG